MAADRVVLASSNSGKLRELQKILHQQNIDLLPQSEFGVTDAEETGLSFVENAIIKARHACEMTKLPSIADDSGIEVDALNGVPESTLPDIPESSAMGLMTQTMQNC